MAVSQKILEPDWLKGLNQEEAVLEFHQRMAVGTLSGDLLEEVRQIILKKFPAILKKSQPSKAAG